MQKVVALDTIRVSSAGGRFEQDESFDVDDDEARKLIERGLVKPAGKAKAKSKAKAKTPPKNKSATPPANKGA